MNLPIGVLYTDRVKPTVALTSPANGATVSGTITVAANASDNDKVASVQLNLDSGPLGAPITVAPYQRSCDTTALTNAAHNFWAVATDRLGNSQQSSNYIVTVNNVTPPPSIPNMPGPSGGGYFLLADGDVAQTGYGPYITYGTWVAAGHTLQYRFHGNYSGDQFKSPHFDTWFNDGSTDQYSNSISGAATDDRGSTQDWYSAWTNVPVGAGVSQLRVTMHVWRDSGGDYYCTFNETHMEFRWV